MTTRYIVTGASSGIGREICRRLLGAGHHVVGIGRDIAKFNPDHPHYRGIAMELAELDELPARLTALVRQNQPLTGIVLCAGRGRFGALEEFSYKQIRNLIDINLVSQIFFARAFLPLMKRQGSGDLILIGSEAGITGGRYAAVYSATKFALRGLAQSLRQECASSGVRVTIINPGMVKTEFFSKLRFEPGADEENFLLPEDVAETVLQILSFRRGTVVDEVNMSPLKKVVRAKK